MKGVPDEEGGVMGVEVTAGEPVPLMGLRRVMIDLMLDFSPCLPCGKERESRVMRFLQGTVS